MALKMHPSLAIHPGEWLKAEIVEPRGLTMGRLAECLGVTRQTASTLLNANQGLTAEMAIRFEKVFGVKADTLLRMQTAYDLAQARAHEDDIKVRELAAA